MRRIARAGKTVGNVALIALYAGTSLAGSLDRLGEVSYGGQWLAWNRTGFSFSRLKMAQNAFTKLYGTSPTH
jgi:hypothetical protein